MDWCFLYKKNKKFMDHLLLHCEVDRYLWDEILNRTDVAWVMSKQAVNQRYKLSIVVLEGNRVASPSKARHIACHKKLPSSGGFGK